MWTSLMFTSSQGLSDLNRRCVCCVFWKLVQKWANSNNLFSFITNWAFAPWCNASLASKAGQVLHLALFLTHPITKFRVKNEWANRYNESPIFILLNSSQILYIKMQWKWWFCKKKIMLVKLKWNIYLSIYLK